MHILPGVDDGARTLDDAIAMAQEALADGVRTVAATPHVRGDYPTSAGVMESRLAELRDALKDAGIPLEVLPGAEIALDRLPLMTEDERARFGLGGNPRCLLLEFAYYGWPLALDGVVLELCARGVTPVLAHPERNGDVQARTRAAPPARDRRSARPGDGRVDRRPAREASAGRRPRAGRARTRSPDRQRRAHARHPRRRNERGRARRSATRRSRSGLPRAFPGRSSPASRSRHGRQSGRRARSRLFGRRGSFARGMCLLLTSARGRSAAGRPRRPSIVARSAARTPEGGPRVTPADRDDPAADAAQRRRSAPRAGCPASSSSATAV